MEDETLNGKIRPFSANVDEDKANYLKDVCHLNISSVLRDMVDILYDIYKDRPTHAELLESHMMGKYSEKFIFVCDACGTECNSRQGLLKHLATCNSPVKPKKEKNVKRKKMSSKKVES